VDEFKARDAEIQNSEAEIGKLNGEIRRAQHTEGSLKRNVLELEQVKTDNVQWGIWSRTLLSRLVSPRDLNIPPDEVRTLLEQVFLTSVGQRSVLRKLEILKAEKRLLKLPRFDFAVSAPRKPLVSIRPLMLAFVFAKTLQTTTGTAKLRFDPLRRDVPAP
jgi:hypothetical protein